MKPWFKNHCILQWNITQPQKEWNNVICSNMDRCRDYPPKWSQTEKDIYMTSLICRILKNDANEVIYKTEMDWDIENILTVIKRESGRGIIRNLGLTKTQYDI